MTTSTTRRSLLRAAPALLAPITSAGPAPASADTPIQRLFQEWGALQAHLNDHPTSQEDVEEHNPRPLAIEDALMAEPVTCAGDPAAKVLMEGLCGDHPELAAWIFRECEAILLGGGA